MTLRLKVTYATGNTHEHQGLDVDRALTGLDAFVGDLVRLEGQGVRSVTLETEDAE